MDDNKKMIVGGLDGLQQKIIEDEIKKKQNEKPKYEFDKLAMFFGEDYEVKGIKISQPTIGDIVRVGEQRFYSALAPFLYNSTSIRVMLWDAGKDWCTVKDIEVFSMLSSIQDYEETKDALSLVFKDTNIMDYKLYTLKGYDEQEDKLFLFNENDDRYLFEEDYMLIAEYIREMLNFHPKVEKAKGKTAKRWMIDEDRMNMLHKNENNSSNLLSLISACVNHPGFKYKLQELREVGICQFMDSVQRLQIYESSRALINGQYSGFADLSKVSKDLFNFMREI